MAAFLRVVRSGQDDFSVTRDGHREYRIGFHVVTDAPLEDLKTASSAPGLPAYLSFYAPVDGTPDVAAFLQDFECTRPDAEAPNVYHVSAVWSTRTPDPDRTGAYGFPGGGGGGGQPPQDDVTLLPKKVRWTHTPRNKLFEKDLDGKAVMTAANEKFDPVPEIEAPLRTLVVTRAKTTFNASLAKNYVGATNEDEFEGEEPGRVMCIQFDAEDDYPKGRRVWWVTAAFVFEDHEPETFPLNDTTTETWSFEYIYIPHYGTKVRPAAGQDPERATDGKGNFIKVNLKPDGTKLADNAPGQFLKFRGRRRMNFAAMGL